MDYERSNTPLQNPAPPNGSKLEDTLFDLMAGCVDSGEVCDKGLKLILTAIGRPAGVLLVGSKAEVGLFDCAQLGLSATWKNQLADSASTLQKLAKECIDRGSTIINPTLPVEAKGMDALAGVFPIPGQTETQGALMFPGEPLSQEHVKLLENLTPIVGRSIQLFRSANDQKNELHKAILLEAELSELALKADWESLQRSLIKGIGQILQSETSILLLIDEENPSWLVYKSLDCDSKFTLHLQPDEDKGPVSECMKSGQVVCLEGAQAKIDFDPGCTSDRLPQTRSLICAPLQAGERTIGALVALNRRGSGYVEADRQVLMSLARSAANSIQTCRLIQNCRVRDASEEANRWELLASQNFVSTLMDYLPACLYIIDQEYQLLSVNKGRRVQTGKTENELIGLPCYQALIGRSEPCPECMVRETLDTGQVTHRSERRYGISEEISDWEITSFPISSKLYTGSQAVLLEMDNTDKRRLEAILTQSEKLAAVGQLAAGIAHEINNPLTAIIANAQILHREIPSDSELQESVELIARAGARAAQVVHNLLDFARKEEYRLRSTDLNKTLELALELVQHELVARGVILEVDLDRNLPVFLASADDLQSVWLNLLLNALDSLDKTPGKIRVSSKRQNGDLLISVTDNGKGIPIENLSQIFEPFYTTKAPGRGTGLGLSVSQNIIKQHGGYFRVDSQVDEGSTFTVIFPAA